MCHVLIHQGIRTVKTFIKYNSATGDKYITKNTSKQCQILRLRNKSNYLNQRYPALTTHILPKISNFCCKIENFEKINLFFASKTTLVLRFMISKKFYYDQTA